MLETTHISGKPPDTSLIYALRRRALDGADILDMFNVIADHLKIPEDNLGRFALEMYVWLAFGGSADDLGNLKHLAYRLERTPTGYSTTRQDIADNLAASINARRASWSVNLSAD
jgi:hypothetical protein